MIKLAVHELKEHAPFTLIGAVIGVIAIIFFQRIPHHISLQIFYVLHPLHVLLSALVTASMYENYKKSKFHQEKYHILVLFLIGYVGSIGIATLSDSLLPYLGESLLKLPRKEIHIGFIEKWWLVNPLALIGITIAYLKPSTKFPHAGHVFLSTFASLFHLTMAINHTLIWYMYPIIFTFLFVSVWIPCCTSDIFFPLLFVGNQSKEKIGHSYH